MGKLTTLLLGSQLNSGGGGGVIGEEITVTPSYETQVITPSAGKNAITKVTVNPQSKYKPNFITFGYRRITTNEELLDLISDINGVDTSNVTKMSFFLRETFIPGGSLTEATLDLTNLNTSKVTDFEETFGNVYIPVTIDISTWDFTKITRENGLYDVFPGYSTTGGVIPIFPKTEQKVNTNRFNNLFYLNLMVKNLDLDFLNNLEADEPSSTTNNTFVSFVRGCENLETLKMKNLSPYKLSSSARQASLSYMFTNCYKLKRIDADNFQFSAVRSNTSYYASVFSNCGRDLPEGEYTKIYVKDATEQQWILNLGANYRPTGWSTDNIIIAGSAADDRTD